MRVHARAEMAWWVVPAAVLGQVWPLLVLLGGFVAAAAAWAVTSGDTMPLQLLWSLLQLAAVGLVGSFVLHESAHVVAVLPAPGVTHIALQRTWLRLSVMPVGDLTPGRAAFAAAAGPLSCVAAGSLGWVVGLPSAWCWCYLAHALLLLPVFGDGRTLVVCLLAARHARRAVTSTA